MRVSRIRIVVIGAAAALFAFAGVASAGNGTHDRIQQKLHDGSCLTSVAAGDQDRIQLHDGTHDRMQQKLQDGSCLTS
jgi:hypothetical protein